MLCMYQTRKGISPVCCWMLNECLFGDWDDMILQVDILRSIVQEKLAMFRCSLSAKMSRDVKFFLQLLDQSSSPKVSLNKTHSFGFMWLLLESELPSSAVRPNSFDRPVGCSAVSPLSALRASPGRTISTLSEFPLPLRRLSGHNREPAARRVFFLYE